ncbi:MAG: threonine synthase [Candidatus Marinimicrobia bacterium]|nr:threonine synthase [Candidatus Neomarinimicrobiota bacterium]
MLESAFICTSCKKPYEGQEIPTLCSCGQPLEIRLDLVKTASATATATINQTDLSLWRYRSVLPPIKDEYITTLIEGWTALNRAEDYLGVSLYFKDETVNPTGSFKDRGMSLAISHLRSYGIRAVCLPSAGNAGVAAAAYCQEAGIECHVYLPETIPTPFVEATEKYGATVRLVGKTIADASNAMKKEKHETWFDLSTLKEPFRVEGKKTLGYEIAEQLEWCFPDVVVYPTGGGTGLMGMWKAFNEMKEMGWVEGNLPRMVVVQSSGCAPIVNAFEKGLKKHQPWQKPETSALGLNVPNPIGGSWMLRVLQESTGIAVMVEEEEIPAAWKEVAVVSGTKPSPEAGVAWLGFKSLVDSGWIHPKEVVIIPITGSGERYG